LINDKDIVVKCLVVVEDNVILILTNVTDINIFSLIGLHSTCLSRFKLYVDNKQF